VRLLKDQPVKIKLRKVKKTTAAGAARTEYGWTAIADNGKKVATSGETYKKLDHCIDMMRMLFPTFELVNERSRSMLTEKDPI
jgi:hypothetical protein